MLENIKETLIKNLSLTTYEYKLIELQTYINSDDKKSMLLLEGESDAYAVLLSKHFPDVDMEQILIDAINKAKNEINGDLVQQDYKIAA